MNTNFMTHIAPLILRRSCAPKRRVSLFAWPCMTKTQAGAARIQPQHGGSDSAERTGRTGGHGIAVIRRS